MSNKVVFDEGSANGDVNFVCNYLRCSKTEYMWTHRAFAIRSMTLRNLSSQSGTGKEA